VAQRKKTSPPKKTLTRDECLMMRQLCASANLRRAARNVTRHYEAALVKAGVTATQLPLLAAVNSSGFRTIAGLAEDLDLERSTVSRDVSVLERNGFVRLRPGKDLRTREVELTTKGNTALVRGFDYWNEAHQTLKDLVGRDFDTMLGAIRHFAKVTQESSASPRAKRAVS
jgi:DNA-binding MarR family transcriptional regulator